jgi:MarR family transcriptional regulator, organic hydroperoxide resistance regulator
MRSATRSSTKSDASDEEQAKLGKVLGFMQLLWAVSHGLHSMSKRMEVNIGVTGPQRLVLRVVGRNAGISAGALAETLRLHPSTLTGVLRRLEQRGMLARVVDPKDGRRALLSLTTAGKGLDGQQAHTVEAAVRRALRRLDEPTLAAAEKAIAAVIEELEKG